jgi:Ca2+-binding EF-hand superfamily protein
MTADEYMKLYRKFDPSGNRKISYYEWNNIVGNLIHPLSDITLSRPDTPKMKEWTRRALQRGLKEQVLDPVQAFRETDSDMSGYISHQEFNQLLRKLGVSFGDDEETFYVFKKYQNKAKNTTGQLNEEEFLALFHDFTSRACRETLVTTRRADTETHPLAPAGMTVPKVSYTESMMQPSLEAVKTLFAAKMFNKYNNVNKAFRTFHAGCASDSVISHDEMKRAFTKMNLPLKPDQERGIISWFDPENKGFITYESFNKVLGAIVLPNAKDTSRAMTEMEVKSGAQDGLVYDPTARLGNNRPLEVREKDKSVKHIVGSAAPSKGLGWDDFCKTFRDTPGFGASSPAKPSPSSANAENAGDRGFYAGASTAADAERDVPAAARAAATLQGPVDVAKLEERMRKTLGRGWVHAAAEIKKQTGGARGASLPVEALRDVLAERAVPMTAREAAALAARYAAPAGGVDTDKMLTHVFKASFAANVPAAKPAVKAAARPVAVAAATVAPSAFIKGGAKKSVSIF